MIKSISLNIRPSQIDEFDFCIEFFDGPWDSDPWEDKLVKMAQGKSKALFIIEELDPNGLIAIVLKIWFKHRESANVKVDNPNIRTVLEISFGNKVKFFG